MSDMTPEQRADAKRGCLEEAAGLFRIADSHLVAAASARSEAYRLIETANKELS